MRSPLFNPVDYASNEKAMIKAGSSSKPVPIHSKSAAKTINYYGRAPSSWIASLAADSPSPLVPLHLDHGQ